MSGPVGVRADSVLDAELVRFTASIGTGEGFRIALDRSPSFFDALEVEGDEAVVAAFVEDGRVVSTGVMTERPAYLDGSRDAGWIGQLGSARVDPGRRSGTLVVRSFRMMRAWHLERRARVFLTTILEDNRNARAVFGSGRAGLPRYRDRGRLVTLNCPVGRRTRRRGGGPTDVEISAGREGEEAAIAGFWREHGRRRQYFPAYQAHDLRSETGLLRGLGVQDLLVARARISGEIVGVLGVWDQGPFRRWVVQGLPRGLSRWAPVIDFLSRRVGGVGFPRPGEALAQRFVAAPCVLDDDAAVFAALLEAAQDRVAGQGGAWLTLGLHERDPLLGPALRLRHRRLNSRLYLVNWPEDEEIAAAIDPERCPYVEVGAL